MNWGWLAVLVVATGAWAQDGGTAAATPAPTAATGASETVVIPVRGTKRPNAATDHVELEPTGPSWFNSTKRFAWAYYEAGIVYGESGLLSAAGHVPVGFTGIRVMQHQGFVSELILKAFAVLLVAMGSVDIQRKVETSRTDIGGGYERVTTTTTTTYRQTKSNEEIQAELNAIEQGVSGNTWFDMTIYEPNLFGLRPGGVQARGYEFNVGFDFPLGGYLGLPIVFSPGLSWGHLFAPTKWTSGGGPQKLDYSSFGFVVRLHVPLWRIGDVFLEWLPNFLTLGDLEGTARYDSGEANISPLSLGAYLNFTDRVYLKGRFILGGLGFSDGRLGMQLEAGVRL